MLNPLQVSRHQETHSHNTHNKRDVHINGVFAEKCIRFSIPYLLNLYV